MKKYLLPPSANTYKANLHCHSTLSDGRLTPEQIKELYKADGYSVIAYTDHDLFISHHELNDDNFLALSGFEVEINEQSLYPGKRHLKCCHLCFIAGSKDTEIQPCWNEKYSYIGNAAKHISKIKFDKTKPPFEREYSPERINMMINEGRKAGFFVTYNHPAWSLENYEQYTKYDGMNALEILNYSCEVMGFPSYAENTYDDMLRKGKKIFAVAADDNHNGARPDSCGGYVMIKADTLNYESIMKALFNGDFYASSGPEIYDLYIEDGKVYVKTSDAVMISLNTGVRPSKAVLAKEGETVNEASFEFDENDIYLRITVKDEKGNKAFTNAFFLEDLQNK